MAGSDDARDRLRRYLEQRRDLGESELVLDGMTVEEVMRILGAKDAGAARPAADVARQVPRGAAEPPAARESRPAREAPPARAERPLTDAEASGDWRAAIRAAGGAPAGDTGMQASPSPGAATPEAAEGKRPPAPAPATSSAPTTPSAGSDAGDDWVTGLTVGTSGRELGGDPIAALESIGAIADAIAQCRRCPLYSTAKNSVPGEGNPDAGLVCVGEAPGQTEDETGRPFVGQAGQLLTKILAAINLAREDVFIVNVLKHRPPGNRNPRPEEVEACSPYLVRQLELIRPRVIVAFGTFAAQTLLNTKLPIGQLRGKVHRYYGTPLVATYHPAALLRNPAWKRPTWEDVQLARRILDRSPTA